MKRGCWPPWLVVAVLGLSGCNVKTTRIEIDVTVTCDGGCDPTVIKRTDLSVRGVAYCDGWDVHQLTCFGAVSYDPVIQRIYTLDGYVYEFEYHNSYPASLGATDEFCIQRSIDPSVEQGLMVRAIVGEGKELYRIDEDGNVSEKSGYVVDYEDSLVAEYTQPGDVFVVEEHWIKETVDLPVEKETQCTCAVGDVGGGGEAGAIAVLAGILGALLGRHRPKCGC